MEKQHELVLTKSAVWIMVFSLIFGAIDIFTTFVILETGGREINPVPAMLIDYFGQNFALFVIFPLIKIFFGFFFLAFVFYSEKRWTSKDWATRCLYYGNYLQMIVVSILPAIHNNIQIVSSMSNGL